ncbi:Amino acid transporter [Mycena sanguinolenta]|uniref:Amino acid transporter n=1 Tax=Mycena sanguinolenta TaxID=230812 RepID=A0A8H6Z783_9AGAR|nr:Amino acid transporter [Mycena sanguinolenta]
MHDDSDSPAGRTNLQDNYAAADLEKLGYKQEMTRSRGLFHILFMTLAIMAVPYGLAAPIATSLVAGGPATIIWGWVFVSCLTVPLACSLGEICAKYPTSAGAYYWCFRLASPRHRLLFSWINGWLTMVGVWTIALSVTFGTAQLIVAGAGIYLPDWVVKPWQTCEFEQYSCDEIATYFFGRYFEDLIFLAVTGVTVIFCVFFNRILPTIDVISAYWTLLGVIVTLVCVSVKAAAGRHSAAFALGHFDPSPSGWTPGWAFFIGLLPVRHRFLSVTHGPILTSSYTFSAIGMIASMAEEVHNPSSDLPRAIVWSIPIGFLTGVFFLVPILFTLPDISTLLAVASGQPVGLMFELIMGSKGGGFGLWFIIFGIGMFCAISISCAASRATWAFARDAAIPFHHTFATINKTLAGGIPLNAILLSTVIQLLLGLIYLGSSAAFNAFVGVAVMCLGASYAMPVAISLANGRKDMADSPFGLGRVGVFLNSVAVVWAMFELILFSMPAVLPTTPTTMNYAPVVFVGFAVISAVWYLISGRYHYKGPSLPEETTSSVPEESAKQGNDTPELEQKEKVE